ncbi:protein FAM76B-like [Panonychus citri]|uniref:protein FAM76B-like n=1 Tax=Panonychus citri TaxID=50023 RepID=UPI002307CDB2|nr:protein FAM76B-like [Panonychus citri]
MRSSNHNYNRSRKLISSCSSYENSSSSSEDERNRDKSTSKTRNKHQPHHPHHNGSSSQHHQSKIGFDSGLNRHRDYIKYSPLHFSPILISSQPMEKPHRMKSSSSSLLAMVRRTSRLLQDEASDLDGLGNYRFVSDISNGLMSRNDLDADESAIRILKQIRCDIDEKLKRLNALVNSTNGEDKEMTKFNRRSS